VAKRVKIFVYQYSTGTIFMSNDLKMVFDHGHLYMILSSHTFKKELEELH
jgi:hypothetical protein